MVVLVACASLASPAAAAAQWAPAPVRGWTEPQPLPPPQLDAGAVAPPPPAAPAAHPIDPAALRAGQLAFEAGSGIPVAYGSADVGLGRGFDLGAELAYHADSTLRLGARAQWGYGWSRVFMAVALDVGVPIYLEDRDVAPDSINDATVGFGLRLRGGVRLGATASLYLEPTVRLVYDDDPRIDALTGSPAGGAVHGVFGAGIGTAIRLVGPLGMHAVARGESGAGRESQAIEFRFGLTLVTDPGRGASRRVASR